MSECCKSGFKWDAQPTGTTTKLGDLPVYVAGDNKSAAILIIHDLFGWTLPNVRLLADHFAKEANATVYLPDFYEGEVVEPDAMSNPEKRAAFDVMAFLGRHNKDKRYPAIVAAAKQLKSQYKKVGAVGYCWGAWAVFKLAGESLIDAASAAHPSLVEKSEIDGLKVPTQILAPETDPQFTPELKEYSNKVIPTLNIPYEYVYFPGVVHGFAVRGDPKEPTQKAALERAKRSTVNWFNEWLH
ncbi:alpha/beta-hydrolase [Delitschia confertaspora ATCC 74209]|uniref:Alpha/beta-hydrolase n=1 Tax=Delitschia confertaspora ATCC 74209 TaxID=1513339 RepID=A0A9P4JMX6_9PLEO|nr:alpha/beta-hydrolase [Delitschia confertaspora ATCC 74209]